MFVKRSGQRSRFVRRFVFMMLLVAVVGSRSLEAGKRGATLIVNMKDGTRAYGELIRVEPLRLVLRTSSSRPEQTLELDQVSTIEIFGTRPFEPRFLNGAALGTFLGLLASSSNRDAHSDYGPQWAPAGLGLLGGLVGVGLEFAGRRSQLIHMIDVSPGERQRFIERLEGQSRETREKDRPWLRGFRVSWRPYFHSSLPFRLDGRLSLPEPYVGMSIETAHLRGQSYPNRLGCVRVEYDVRPWLLVGLEYLSLGGHRINGIDYPRVAQDGQDFVSGVFTSGFVASSVTSLGVSVGAASGPRGELGVGLARSSLEDFGPEDAAVWSGDAVRSLRLKSDIVLRLGASWEFSSGDPVSAGVFADYLILRPSVPDTTFNGRLRFYPGTELSIDKPVAFELDSVLTYPAQRIDLTGFSIGIFLRLK